MKNKRQILIIISLTTGIVMGILVYYLLYKVHTNKVENNKQTIIPERQLIIENVRKLIEIPPEEELTVATVIDKEALSKYQFFSKAQNGDKLIILPKSMKAILYRPSINKIIDVVLIAPETKNEQEKKELKIIQDKKN